MTPFQLRIFNEAYRDLTDSRLLFKHICVPASARFHGFVAANDVLVPEDEWK